ncbi:hypothetical protein [Oceanispirochaeta sp.]|jgi:hypothetical protein|uniref:hypothetical protein n=1 Tax=Oceanispirochaeta sp. TaxID=2035350 RepID=UPI00261A4E44|nr:hypothetical protein [Oceanispirochaeta sp.]MDA3955558.1 hypothetical protein [Oceanispirochaeta sp.]
MNKCYFCGKESTEKVYRNSLCSECGKELKICYNCIHFDKASANQCREPQAEKVVEKDRANFCDYFSASGQSHVHSSNQKLEDAKKKIEDFFS